MAAVQRIAHQPPQARCIVSHQKRHDLAREAVGLHARVSWRLMAGLNRDYADGYLSPRDDLCWRRH